MRVDTDHYKFAHGKAPRGFGNWFFTWKENGHVVDDMVNVIGKYSYAKGEALKQIKAQHPNATEVIVCS